MKEIIGDIWDYWETGYPICITINGFVKRNGEAMMGRGVALQAKQRFPHLPQLLGTRIRQHGWQRVTYWGPGLRLITFPVKRDWSYSDGTNVVQHLQHKFPCGSRVPGWALKAELQIIEESLRRLDKLRKRELGAHIDIVLPRPGCGAGELEWQDVFLSCAAYGDWLHIITLPESDF